MSFALAETFHFHFHAFSGRFLNFQYPVRSIRFDLSYFMHSGRSASFLHPDQLFVSVPFSSCSVPFSSCSRFFLSFGLIERRRFSLFLCVQYSCIPIELDTTSFHRDSSTFFIYSGRRSLFVLLCFCAMFFIFFSFCFRALDDLSLRLTYRCIGVYFDLSSFIHLDNSASFLHSGELSTVI